jgi:hypothetical protein
VYFGSPHIDREFIFLDTAADKNSLSLNVTRVGIGPDGKPTGENDRLAEALVRARATDDPAEQKRQYEVVQHEMARQLGLVFLVGQSSAVAFDKRTHGLSDFRLPGPDGKDGPEILRTGIVITAGAWRTAG